LLRLQERRNVDVTLRQFIASSVRLLIIVMTGMVALNGLGVNITPLIAALGGQAGARGYNRGSIFTADGMMVASMIQEGLMRVRP
jgi:small conductance mechanosensitive channel|tara:strand:- start:10479 stop:10733 length:255 start_codon:yes stop_codon:yes gene_type:complete